MKQTTPLKAIRANCLDCSGGSMREVRYCQHTDCIFHEYRMGKNPKRKGVGGRGKPKRTKNLTCVGGNAPIK